MKSVITFIFLVLPSLSFAQTYEIRLKNRAKQVLTSSVCATHSRATSIFTPGEVASAGLSTLAEDGSTSTYASELRGVQGVNKVFSGPFIFSKSSETITFTTPRVRRRLSCVLGMLIATNDGFPGFRNVRLPRKIGATRKIRARAYDAGSEVNTESCDHVPGGPCNAHFVGIKEGGVITRHQGIQGIGDLTKRKNGWPRIVVRGEIVRIN